MFVQCERFQPSTTVQCSSECLSEVFQRRRREKFSGLEANYTDFRCESVSELRGGKGNRAAGAKIFGVQDSDPSIVIN